MSLPRRVADVMKTWRFVRPSHEVEPNELSPARPARARLQFHERSSSPPPRPGHRNGHSDQHHRANPAAKNVMRNNNRAHYTSMGRSPLAIQGISLTKIRASTRLLDREAPLVVFLQTQGLADASAYRPIERIRRPA